MMNQFLILILVGLAAFSESSLGSTNDVLNISPMEACLLLLRPSDIVITDATKDGVDYMVQTGTYVPAAIIDTIAGRMPYMTKNHSGVIYESDFYGMSFRDIYSVQDQPGSFTYDDYFLSSGESITIYRAKYENLKRDNFILDRADEYYSGQRKAPYCSVSVVDMYGPYLLSETTPTSLIPTVNILSDYFAKQFQTPTGLSQSSLLKPVCRIKNGKLVIPNKVLQSDILENIRYLSGSKNRHQQNHLNAIKYHLNMR